MSSITKKKISKCVLLLLLRKQQSQVNIVQFSCQKYQITQTSIELSAVFSLIANGFFILVTTFELLRTSLRSSLYNTVIEFVRFAPL